MLSRILDGIDAIRERPVDERRSVGFSFALGITGVIALLWAATLPFGGGTVAQQQESESNAEQVTQRFDARTQQAASAEAIGAFSVIKQDVSRAFEAGSRAIRDVITP